MTSVKSYPFIITNCEFKARFLCLKYLFVKPRAALIPALVATQLVAVFLGQGLMVLQVG
jgi:hypothetical protein